VLVGSLGSAAELLVVTILDIVSRGVILVDSLACVDVILEVMVFDTGINDSVVVDSLASAAVLLVVSTLKTVSVGVVLVDLLAPVEELLAVIMLDTASVDPTALDLLASVGIPLVVMVLETVSDGVVLMDVLAPAVELILKETREDDEAENEDRAEDGVDAGINETSEDDEDVVDDDGREDELVDNAVDEVLVILLASELLLLPELEILSPVTEVGNEEEAGLAGTPTMTYPAFVPEGGIVEVYPEAPAGSELM
jgi:hypothetical protein